MQPGGVITPINGDLVVCHEPERSLKLPGLYVLCGYPNLSTGEVYQTHDEAMAAAKAKASTALVNVFYCELPAQPALVTQFRAL
jgi:hypothetical protein